MVGTPSRFLVKNKSQNLNFNGPGAFPPSLCWRTGAVLKTKRRADDGGEAVGIFQKRERRTRRRGMGKRPVPGYRIYLNICAVISLIVTTRFILLIGMGVGQNDLQNAMLDFPPPPALTGTGPFPLMLKFHKVAGSTVVETLWRNIQCGNLQTAWRSNLCGEYDTHKNLMFVRGGLPHCTRTPKYKTVAIFRRPLDKFVSTLYWYPPYRLRAAHPWTTHIGNWTRDDVNFMLSKLAEDRNPHLIPPLQEYTAVLGSGNAHGDIAYSRRSFRKKGGADAKLGIPDSNSDPIARRRAITRIKTDSNMILGITERLDESMVLIALSLGWPVKSMIYESKKRTGNLKPGDNRYNVNSGKYHMMSPSVKGYIQHLLHNDERVYNVVLSEHISQTKAYPDFDSHVADFKRLLSAPESNKRSQCLKKGDIKVVR